MVAFAACCGKQWVCSNISSLYNFTKRISKTRVHTFSPLGPGGPEGPGEPW